MPAQYYWTIFVWIRTNSFTGGIKKGKSNKLPNTIEIFFKITHYYYKHFPSFDF